MVLFTFKFQINEVYFKRLILLFVRTIISSLIHNGSALKATAPITFRRLQLP
jgi:hypothetical protein